MSLHIQLSEEAEAELKKTAARNKASSTLAGFLFLLLGGLVLYFTVILIAGPSDPEFMTYTPPVEDAPPAPQPVTQDLSSKPSSPAHDVAPSVIVAVGPALVNLAVVDVHVSDDADGNALELGVGIGTGDLGDNLGDEGIALGDRGVKRGGSALEGTFYDLKQTRNGSPMAYSNESTAQVLHDFTKSWNAGILSKYYQSPTKLYASNFCLPNCKAEYAPIAYQCRDKVRPAHWVAVYRGKVKAPYTGTMRFCGTGDDTLCVRFNNDTVLEAGWTVPSTNIHAGGASPAYRQNARSGNDPAHKGYEFITRPELPTWNGSLGGLTAGKEIKVEEGKTYPIEILISEIPGGAFGFVLLTQKKGLEGYDNNKFDLFRTNFATPTAAALEKLISAEGCSMGKMEFPVFNQDSPIWVATP